MHTQLSPGLVSTSPIYAVIDTETTGKDPKTDTLVEVGAVLYQDGKPIRSFQSLVNPERHIPASASAIHHLCDVDVIGAAIRNEVVGRLREFLEPASVYVAHNASFDSALLPELSARRWLCTLRLARHLWPEADGHSNQTLRYYLELDRSGLDDLSMHRVLGDIAVTAGILERAKSEVRREHGMQSLKWLCDFADSPITMPVMVRGGKRSRGLSFSELSTRDLEYWQQNDDGDRDLLWNVEQELYIRWAVDVARQAS